MKKTALITGILGQDGAYLAQFLINKNYRVIGTTKSNFVKDIWPRLRNNGTKFGAPGNRTPPFLILKNFYNKSIILIS